MKTRWLFLSLGLVVGCGPLLSHPGDEFRVTAVSEDVSLIQHVGPVDLEFDVDGCDDFTTTIKVAGGGEHTLDAVQSLGRGRYSARVPSEDLHPPDEYCSYDAATPQGAGVALEVTCRTDRRMQRANLRINYAPAWRATYRARGPSDGVFRGPTPDKFFDVGSGWLDAVDESGVGRDVFAAVGPSEAPLLAATSEGAVYLHAGCPINDCGMFWFVDTPAQKIGSNAAYLQAFEFRGSSAGFVRNVKVPGGAVDLAVEDDGSAVVLARLTSTTTITRVVGDTTSSIMLDGEGDPTRFAGSGGGRVFLTRVGDTRARLRRVDGSLAGEVAIPGAGTVEYVSLAPSADAFVTIRGEQAWVTALAPAPGGLAATSTQLATALTGLSHQSAEDSSFGAAWTDTGIVLRDRSGVEVYSRTAPFARKWNAVLERGAVVNALAVGEAVAVVTQSGLQIFDGTGKLTGGADPMPPACALAYSPRHAAVVGPDTIALSGKRAIYQFRTGAF